MIVLGIDPGIAITGCAIVEDCKGKQNLLYSETITTSAKTNVSLRLLTLYKALSYLVKKHKPDLAALESLFFNTNAKTAMIVGQARGVVQLVCAQNNLQVTEYTPLQVKMALTGYGRAEKNQMQNMVKQILKLPEILTPDDTSDAAAIALTHCFSYKMKSQCLVTSVLRSVKIVTG